MRSWNYLSTRRVFALLLGWVICVTVHAQRLKKLKEVDINEPVAVSVDRRGSVLIADRSGSINKYSNEGVFELNYSPNRNTKVSLIEAWTTLDVLVFYEGIQSIAILNRFLTPISTIDLTPYVGFARLVTYSYESNIWIVDDTDFTLKLLDVELQKVVSTTPLNSVLNMNDYDISFMREYQNLLFISDLNSGILVFDNLGNYLRTIVVTGVSYFGFEGNDIYYSVDGELIYSDLYSAEERKIQLPAGGYNLSLNGKILSVGQNRMTFYQP